VTTLCVGTLGLPNCRRWVTALLSPLHAPRSTILRHSNHVIPIYFDTICSFKTYALDHHIGAAYTLADPLNSIKMFL